MYKKVFCQSKPFGFFAVLVDVPVVVAKLPNDSGHLLHLNVLSAVTLSGHRPFTIVDFVPQLSCLVVIDHV